MTVTQHDTPTVGFIGQGFIGKHLANNFEKRGFSTVRYALEPEYADNKSAVAACPVIFIAVPTPTTPEGFDDSILKAVVAIPAPASIVVIKSTVLPGTTKKLQAERPDITLLHVPEFLREKHAAKDTDEPERTIVGMPAQTDAHKDAAEMVMAILPDSPHQLFCTSDESELIKYGGNGMLMLKLVYMNLLHDMADALGANYEVIAGAMAADPRIGGSHMSVIDRSGHPGSHPGRGAGGHCFPKDWAAMREAYETLVPDDRYGLQMIEAVEKKNRMLLEASQKDLDLLKDIYGSARLHTAADDVL